MRKSSIDDPALGHAGRAAGFEDVDRPLGKGLGHPAAHGPATEPLVLERFELFQVVEALDLGERIELQRLLILQPERTTG